MRDRLMIEHQDNVARMGFSKPCMARTPLTDTHRLTIYQGENWGELYDLQSDFDESRNLWDDCDHAAIRASMIEALAQEMMRNVDQSPRARRRA